MVKLIKIDFTRSSSGAKTMYKIALNVILRGKHRTYINLAMTTLIFFFYNLDLSQYRLYIITRYIIYNSPRTFLWFEINKVEI